jgi:hypothetical protein
LKASFGLPIVLPVGDRPQTVQHIDWLIKPKTFACRVLVGKLSSIDRQRTIISIHKLARQLIWTGPAQ